MDAYFYLQRVIESVSGKPFDHFMREEVLDPLGMKQSSYVWLPHFDSRMAAGYDRQENRLDVLAAMGRRALTIADAWRKPLTDWRYNDAAKAVPLINAQWPILPLYMIPNAASSLLTTVQLHQFPLSHLVAGPEADGLKLAPTTWEAIAAPRVAQQCPVLGIGMGNSARREWTGAVALGSQQFIPQFRHCQPPNRRARGGVYQ